MRAVVRQKSGGGSVAVLRSEDARRALALCVCNLKFTLVTAVHAFTAEDHPVAMCNGLTKAAIATAEIRTDHPNDIYTVWEHCASYKL